MASEVAKHTPGPWTHMAGMPTNILDGGGLRVARCDFDGDFDHPQAHANARLIAAAPELLAALTAMCNRFPYWFPHDSGHCDPAALALVTNARAAIAKATN